MRYYKAIFLTLPFLFFWIIPATGAVQNDFLLESVTFHQISGKDESVSFDLNGENIPKIFLISGDNPRLVVDFINTGCSVRVDRHMDINGKMVKRIRVGIHNEQPPKTRVVVDLIPGGIYRYTQHFDPQEKRLLLSIFPKEEKASPTKERLQNEAHKKAPVENHEPAVQQQHAQAKVATVAPMKKKAESGKLPKEATTAQIKKETRNQEHKEIPVKPQETVAGPEQAPAKVAIAKPAKKEVESGKPNPEAKGAKRTAGKEKEKVESEKKTVDKQSMVKKPKTLLSSVTFEKTASKGEMVLFKLNDFFPPKVFGIEKGEPRVILDFLDTELGDQVKNIIHCDGKYVQLVRISKQTKPGKVRVVLHLSPHRNYDLQQVFFKEDNLFVIIVNTQEALPEAQKTPPSKI
jgi:AMIN domain